MCCIPSKSQAPFEFEAGKSFILAIMSFFRVLLVALYASAATDLATSPPVPPTTPIVTLDQGKFIGTTVGSVNKYLGIPYAQPPSVVDFVLVLNPLATNLPNRQSWKSALPSSQLAFSLRRRAQRYCIRSFVLSAGACPCPSRRVTCRDSRGTRECWNLTCTFKRRRL